jgi:hypothetical protein
MAAPGAVAPAVGRSEHEQYADAADDYLDEHNVYEMFSGLMRKLVINKPKDPLAFLIAALEQPVQQVREQTNPDSLDHRPCRPAIVCSLQKNATQRAHSDSIVYDACVSLFPHSFAWWSSPLPTPPPPPP